MGPFTPAQQKQLQVWADQRDALLREISVHTTELEEKKAGAIKAGEDCRDFENRAAEARGRLAELTALEDRMKNSVSIEVAELIAQKSRLESECAAKAAELVIFDVRGTEKVELIKTLSVTYAHMSDQATIVDQVVGKVIEVSKNAISEIGTSMAEIRTVALEVIAKSNENIGQANIVIEKMPKMIFNMQKPIPVRRTYPAGHPNAHLGVVAEKA